MAYFKKCIADTPEKLDLIQKTLKKLDSPVGSMVFPLEYAKAKEVEAQITKIVKYFSGQLAETKKSFVKKAASIIEENINKTLRKEIGTFHNDALPQGYTIITHI